LGGGRVTGEVERGRIRSLYFIYLYENRTIKLVEIILSTGEEGEGE
jgi:hypothetical protein